MSHAHGADKLLIKPTAGARPASPYHADGSFRKARTKRPVPRRVTRGTTTTRLATAPDGPTQRVLPPPEDHDVDGDRAEQPGSEPPTARKLRAATLDPALRHESNARLVAV
jgi:hypothetical protein